jgi:hypothetical protein
MSKIEEIESQIRELNPDELTILRRWVLEFDFEVWDRQIEADARDGKLESLVDNALREHENGHSTIL